MSVKMRQHVERQIARRLILDALAAGYAVAVDDGEETFGPFTKCKEVLDKMFSVDDEHLHFYKEGKSVAWAWFVYGNGGYDVISDYSTNLDPIMGGANKLADKYGG